MHCGVSEAIMRGIGAGWLPVCLTSQEYLGGETELETPAPPLRTTTQVPLREALSSQLL